MKNAIDCLVSGRIASMDLSEKGFWFATQASCECDHVLIRFVDRTETVLVSAKDCALHVELLKTMEQCRYIYRFIPREELAFIRLSYDEGIPACLKLRYGDGYLFISASDDWLIMSVGHYDITGEDATDIPEYEDAELELWKIKEGSV